MPESKMYGENFFAIYSAPFLSRQIFFAQRVLSASTNSNNELVFRSSPAGTCRKSAFRIAYFFWQISGFEVEKFHLSLPFPLHISI